MDNFLSVSNIVKELNMGKATLKFILKRFETLIPSEVSKGQRVYPDKALTIIAIAREKLDMGVLPSKIEEQLRTLSLQKTPSVLQTLQNDDIRLSQDGLLLLKSAFHDIAEQQRRIAQAHEKRAAAEERKAVAIEKRAGAEEKKAQAMNNIANALQEMNKIRSSLDPSAQQIIAHQAVSVIAEDENSLNAINDLSEIKADLEHEIKLDDLSALIEDNETKPDDEDSTPAHENLDDLSSLIDDISSRDIQIRDIKIDDLYELIDDKPSETVPLDDLSLLINDAAVPMEMDDLSLLVESSKSHTRQQNQLDDLSLLVDMDKATESSNAEPASGVSDTGTPDTAKQDRKVEMDDLSKLIDDQNPSSGRSEKNTDDNLVQEITPEIKIDIEPDQDLKKYKAAIMKIIIGFKTDGINAEKATDILNKNNIKTLSGKPQWTRKAISQIYKFIESAS